MSTVKLIPQALLNEIERERHRQEAKFPGQVLPATVIQRVAAPRGYDQAVKACQNCGVPTERWAKQSCDERPDWSRIIVEEVSETISAAGRGDAVQARIEAIQVAASAIRFIGAIDRGEVGF